MNPLRNPRVKITERDALLDRYKRPRDGCLVFTNGCFDLLHRGHAEYLLAARQLGDALVVAINSDASVRRLKGPGRPLTNQDDRAFVVASLACVDAVTVFEEDTPRNLIASLLPDILVKGGDYRVENLAGRAEVETAGGRAVVLPFVPGYSTSELVRRIGVNHDA